MQKRQEPHVRVVHRQRGGASYRRDLVQLRGPSKHCGDCVLLEESGVRVSGVSRCLVETVSNAPGRPFDKATRRKSES